MKIYSFDWEEDDPIFNFKLLGLSSNLTKDYEFAFYLNKYCLFNLKRVDDQVIMDQKIPYKFSVFKFYHLKTKQKIELISNYSFPEILKKDDFSLFEEVENTKILMPEYKAFNYFLKFDFFLDEEFYVTLQNLKMIKEYQYIDLENIKINNLENLILPT
ncbi:IPExxxVDY family protein [Apibacter adventoris]|uniref:IPExxxVDY family protein n=1 Tax=Apibacter adventoris TaxID=1679466 RepID=A0A2S8A750_9FLAO|nr:IPExxxVDY family protein [Apibacter adventoris]PQL90378.1 IPExxxVDY family protein [Apibacter adventoris]PQL95788.1 IPExxxVDY family protein [Apibacter adventoris]